MKLFTFHDPGLGHLSYLLGDKGEAAVVDPRRDIDVYLEKAEKEGLRIKYVFETHRHEDLVSGATALAARSGARVMHGPVTPFEYGERLVEGDELYIGRVRLRVLETPGHTDDSLSFVVHDGETGEEPVGVFTGDLLFSGDVGRTDLQPDRREVDAGNMYDSITDKLFPLGDHASIWPAHGAGSVCGDSMAERSFSTIGYEKKSNPALQVEGRDDFIRQETEVQRETPPYFDRMERVNTRGARVLETLPRPLPMHPEQIEALVAEEDHVVLDCRSPEAVCGAHIPGALAIPKEMIGAFGGWFINDIWRLILVIDDQDDIEPVVRSLVRIGCEHIEGYLEGGMNAWESAGKGYTTFPAAQAGEVANWMVAEDDWTLLDVRSEAEWDEEHVEGAEHRYLGHLPRRLSGLHVDRPITTFCGSGRRATIAASVLEREGFAEVDVCLGSIEAFRALGLPTVKPRKEERKFADRPLRPPSPEEEVEDRRPGLSSWK